MYTSLVVKSTSHKDVAAASNPLLRLYYQNRNFMGSLCIGAEFFYIALYLLSEHSAKFANFREAPAVGSLPADGLLMRVVTAGYPQVVKDVITPGNLSAFEAVLIFFTPLWVLKQASSCRWPIQCSHSPFNSTPKFQPATQLAIGRPFGRLACLGVAEKGAVSANDCYRRSLVSVVCDCCSPFFLLQATNVLQLQFSAARLAKHA